MAATARCHPSLRHHALSCAFLLTILLNQFSIHLPSFTAIITSSNDPQLLVSQNATSITITSTTITALKNATAILPLAKHNNTAIQIIPVVVPQKDHDPIPKKNSTIPNNEILRRPSPYDHIVFQYRKQQQQQHQQDQQQTNLVNQQLRLPENSIPVVLWPLMDSATKPKSSSSADVVHIEENGVQESSVLTLASAGIRTLHPNVVWVTDTKFPYKLWCLRLHQKVLLTQERRRTTTTLPLSWPVYVVDFTDTTHYETCPPLEDALGADFVFYSKRSIVANRTWNKKYNQNNDDEDWLDLGQRLPETWKGRFYQHTPLIVRTDIVEAVSQRLQDKYQLSLHDDDPAMVLERSVDIAHYWPASTDAAVFSNLRNRVSTLIVDHFSFVSTGSSSNISSSGGKNYTVVCDFVGTADRVGRRHAQTAYVSAMLDTKIVVTAQRDKWEDHYRLYEALASGAMVMTDQMLSLPAGLRNGTNIIEFSSADEFVRLARYYLEHDNERQAIAQQGRYVAMSRHRSWHRMEEIILGQPVTVCYDNNNTPEKNSEDPCPYIIHANETTNTAAR
jgi:hypothetical protein